MTPNWRAAARRICCGVVSRLLTISSVTRHVLADRSGCRTRWPWLSGGYPAGVVLHTRPRLQSGESSHLPCSVVQRSGRGRSQFAPDFRSKLVLLFILQVCKAVSYTHLRAHETG